MNKGIKKGFDGFVYFSDSMINATKFLVVRGIAPDNVIVFQIATNKLDKRELLESFDHSNKFFGCRAWCYSLDIPENFIDYKKTFIMKQKSYK